MSYKIRDILASGGIFMKLKNGIDLHVITTSKFKDIGISIRFMNQLEEKQATIRSLLALMMCDRCEQYNTKQAMSRKMDELFGATFSAQTVGYGAAQVVDIRSKIIHPSYTSYPNLLEDWFDFMQTMILQPFFNEEVLNENKAILYAKMKRMQDEPAQYAVSKGLKLAGEGTPLGISALGEISYINEISLDDVKQAYQNLLKEDRMDILICGDIKEEEVKVLLEERFDFQKQNQHFETYYKVSAKHQHKQSSEYRNISQSNIMMTWFTDTSMIEDDYYALKVANAIFGQYPSSFLFQEVREKNSLCYSIYSNLITFDGALAVTTGIEKAKIEQAIDLINEQFERVCDGDFDEELLTISKTMIVNSLMATKDNMQSLLALAYQNAILNKRQTVDDLVNKMQSVTKDDVQKAIKKCTKAYTFILTSEEGSNAKAD